jgi:hypothetical protein
VEIAAQKLKEFQKQSPKNSTMLLCYFPDMATRIGKAGRANTPGPIHWPVQEGDTTARELGARSIDIIHVDREHRPRAGLPQCHPCRRDQLVANVFFSRLSVLPILKTVEFESSNVTGSRKTRS